MNELQGLKVAILVIDDFERAELVETRNTLEQDDLRNAGTQWEDSEVGGERG